MEDMLSIVSLHTNIASASVSNVNIVCYTASSHPPNVVSVTDISPQFLNAKPSVPLTWSCTQSYKTCQHQQKT